MMILDGNNWNHESRILYIGNRHCTSVAQLKGYFYEDLTPESDIYADLLDYGRYGDISKWLRDMGEAELATSVDSIDTKLSDSAFYVQLKAAITGSQINPPSDLRPTFDKCFSFEGVTCDVKDNEATVSVSLKVLMCVNEDYKLSVSCNWGMRGMVINPFSHPEGKTASFEFTLRKRPGKDIGEISVKADDKALSSAKSINNNTSTVDFIVEGVTFKMIHVEGGMFTMGATFEQGHDVNEDEKPVHRVTLNSYSIGDTPVTQELWRVVMGKTPSRFMDNQQKWVCPRCGYIYEGENPPEKCPQCWVSGRNFKLGKTPVPQASGNNTPSYFMGDQNPVEQVSWDDCQKFIRMLNQKTGKDFRLPTEAEWEFAARGGMKSQCFQYSGSNNIDEVAWYNGNSSQMTHPVKTKNPNELGIYDMSGNVGEWCLDWYAGYTSSSQTNPVSYTSGSSPVFRGGSWRSGAGSCRLSYRNYRAPGEIYDNIGLRLVLPE